jgi:tRNA G37 N-methylase Trm5
MKEQMRFKLESQGINVDQIRTIEDFEKLNLNLEDEYDKINESRLVKKNNRKMQLIKYSS